MKIKILSSFIIIIGFMGCSHKATTLAVDAPQKSTIDESKEVLMRMPENISFINDSVVAASESKQKLSLYNFYSGKNLQNFALVKFNFDSLIAITYGKKYAGIKKYTYSQDYELNGANYQLLSYYHDSTGFYVFISLIAQVDDLKDSTAIKKLMNSAKKQGVRSEDATITIMDYVNFVFSLSDNLQVREIIPMYAEDAIRLR